MAYKLSDMLNDCRQDLSVNFCGELITIPSGKILYSHLANKYKDIAIDAHNKFQSKCNTISSWQGIEDLLSYFDEATYTIAKYISEDAISVKYYALDQNAVVNMCVNEGYFDAIYNPIMNFCNQVQEIRYQSGLISEGLDEIKENRAKFGVMTLSNKVTDMVKTQFKADLINAAVGLVYEAKNQNTNSKVQKAAEEKINSMFGFLRIDIIMPALSALQKMFSILIKLLDSHIPGVILAPTQEDSLFANSIYNNIESCDLPIEEKYEMARQVVQLVPSDSSYFNEFYRKFPEYKFEIYNAAKLIGSDISQYLFEFEYNNIKSDFENPNKTNTECLDYIENLLKYCNFKPNQEGKLYNLVFECLKKESLLLLKKAPYKFDEFEKYINDNACRFNLSEYTRGLLINKGQKKEKQYLEEYINDRLEVTVDATVEFWKSFTNFADTINMSSENRKFCYEVILSHMGKLLNTKISQKYNQSLEDALNCWDVFSNYANELNLTSEDREYCFGIMRSKIEEIIISRLLINNKSKKDNSYLEYINERPEVTIDTTVEFWKSFTNFADTINMSSEKRKYCYKLILSHMVELLKEEIRKKYNHNLEDALKCWDVFSNYADELNLPTEDREYCYGIMRSKIEEEIIKSIGEYKGNKKQLESFNAQIVRVNEKIGLIDNGEKIQNALKDRNKQLRTVNGIEIGSDESIEEIQNIINNNPDVFNSNYKFKNIDELVNAIMKIKELPPVFNEKLKENLTEKIYQNNGNLILNNPPEMVYHSDYEEYIMFIQKLPINQKDIDETVGKLEYELQGFENNCKKASLCSNKFRYIKSCLANSFFSFLVLAVIVLVI